MSTTTAYGGSHLRESHSLCCQVRTRRVARVQPYGLGVLGVTAPPGGMLVCAARQLLAYGLGNVGKGHLDARMSCLAEVTLKALVLLASHHGDILPHSPKAIIQRAATLGSR